ncbi:C4-dicarboxylate ABC transporter substrate-binding protein [Chroococcidiopsis cubana SAG 39.79]|uniref:C4-dicarboxylate ABC transporter substrate-binding protein n=1 Tax=Chroococcidiopsis cubana SAG 39.79 TaxID=388085 RepID=A0AB37U9S3_9CYAN|nr:TRAP transporter small permease subunit [Chroococcidiopsis cubana]RUT00881.1 C4-dicarboxylate ABC transporter substrate-binding protein [Chroococcidiopsis cubana SAG 39.79]
MRIFLKPSHICTLIKLSQAIDRVTDVIGSSGIWLVILLIAIGFYNVVARYIGRAIGIRLSSNTLIELQWYLFSLMFFLGFAYILKSGANVRVDILYTRWSEKRRALIDFLGTVFFLIPFCVLGIWVSINPVLQSWGLLPDGTWGSWELSSDADGLPRAPIKTTIIVAFATLLAQGVSQAIKYLAILKGYTQVAQTIQEDAEQLPLE